MVENIGNALLVIWATYWLYKDWHVMGFLAKLGFLLLAVWGLAVWTLVETNKKLQNNLCVVLLELSGTLRELREYLVTLKRDRG